MAESDLYSASWVPTPGTVLEDRYRVVNNLDRGGMGVLVRADDTKLGRQVAIKMVSPRLARTGSYRERFEREVELASRIDHPNVIRCHDYGVTEMGALFLVMELLDGLGLTEVIRNAGRLGTHRAVELGLQLLDGLSAAHALGIVHRDLKPSNVYVVEDHRGREVVKVLDFGLAKSLENEQIRLTKTGMICGTAAYVAPETLVVEQPGKEADIYAVGLIMLEMLFGRRVYPSQQMAQTFMEQLVVPARIPLRVWDQPLGRILSKALQKHPRERYADAGSMHDALAATVDQIDDFVLANDEIPPGAHELSKELLDDLADGRYRTIDTLYKLPAPQPWSPGDEESVNDVETLRLVLDEISRSDIHAAFDTIREGRADTPRLSNVRQNLEAVRSQLPDAATMKIEFDTPLVASEKTTVQFDPNVRTVGLFAAPAVVEGDEPSAASEPERVEARSWIAWAALLVVVGLGTATAILVLGDEPEPAPVTPPAREQPVVQVPPKTAVPEPAELDEPMVPDAIIDLGSTTDAAAVDADVEPKDKAPETVRKPRPRPRPSSKPKSTRPEEPPPEEPVGGVPDEAADRIVDQLPMP